MAAMCLRDKYWQRIRTDNRIPSEDASNITLSADDQTNLEQFVELAHQNVSVLCSPLFILAFRPPSLRTPVRL